MPFSVYRKMLEDARLMSAAGADGSDAGGSGGDAGAGAGSEGAGEGSEADKAPADQPGDKSAEGEEGSKLSDKEAELLKDVMKHKTRAKQLEQSFEQANSELAKIKATLGDMSLEDLNSVLKERKDKEIADLEQRGEYSRIVEQMREENTKVVDQIVNEKKQIEEKLQGAMTQIEELTIGRKFLESKFIADDILLPQSIARREFGPHFDLVDGKVVGFDKPRGSSDRTPLVDGKGEYLSFDAALERLVEKHPDSKDMRRSKVKTGANSSTETKVPGTRKPAAAPNVRGQSRIEMALSKH